MNPTCPRCQHGSINHSDVGLPRIVCLLLLVAGLLLSVPGILRGSWEPTIIGFALVVLAFLSFSPKHNHECLGCGYHWTA